MKSLLIALLLLAPAAAELRDIHIVERADVAGGKSFGKAGAYERIVAKASFTVDPRLPANRIVNDLRYAPTNDAGLVEFSADIYVIKPRDPATGNGTVLFEVSNRGNRGMLNMFDYGGQQDDGMGDGFLLRQGYTLAWCGWQFDVPGHPGAIRVQVPNAQGITGLVRAQEAITKAVATMGVADRTHKPYPAIDAKAAGARMFIRDYGDGPRRELPRSQWRFTDPVTVALDGGFQPGKLYEVVYESKDPGVSGLGPAAIRDFLSFLKHGGGGPTTVLGDQHRYVKRAIAFGSSQSGRFLRDFVYQGFNADERGRIVFDGMMPHIAGGSRGSFMHRFAQPSRLGTQLHGDLFPFRDLTDRDPVTGITDGILRIAQGTGTVPRIFYTNTANEYWRASTSLLHTSTDGRADVPLAPMTRIYFLTGSQHGSAAWPGSKNPELLYGGNVLDYRPMMRALLTAMNEWLTSGKEPPPSRYPSNEAGQLADPSDLHFPKIPDFRLPVHVWQARRLDYGPDFRALGVISREPPKIVGEPFGVRLPRVDPDGNEMSGLRNPSQAVPLGTHLGWNLTRVALGPDTEIAGLTGSYIPFAKTRAERERAGDARLSIEERYKSREDYLQRVDAAARELVAGRYLLADDLSRIRERAAAEWDTLTK